MREPYYSLFEFVTSIVAYAGLFVAILAVVWIVAAVDSFNCEFFTNVINCKHPWPF